jgi:hypothetical protein
MGENIAAFVGGFLLVLLFDRLMLIIASLRVRPTVGDPCEQLSDERTYGDAPKLPRDFVGERISHSTENDRG